MSTNLGLDQAHIFCVRNRTQTENEEAISLSDVRERELKFFSEHEELQHLPGCNRGIAALSSQLVQLQYERICSTLPGVAKQLRTRLHELEEALTEFACMPATEAECRTLWQQRVQKAVRQLGWL